MQTCTINGLTVGRGRPIVMGVINLSPESFFSGSFVPSNDLYRKAVSMTENGADIIDVGARSTAPGSQQISVQEEIERIIEALKILDGSGITISVDTMHPSVLKSCIRHEIHVANDISGLMNPDYGSVVSDAGLPAIVMTANSKPGDITSFSGTVKALDTLKTRCAEAGIEQYILDPGVGHWIPERSNNADWELCQRFHELKQFDRPLLAAISRKTFIGEATNRTPDQRLAGTLGVTAYLLMNGADMIRCHDIPETYDLIRSLDSLGVF